MNLDKMRKLVKSGKYEISDHALRQSRERRIFLQSSIEIILNGEEIEDYPNDKPFPSCLILGWIENRPIHIVVAMDEKTEIVLIITVYEPSQEKFESDYKVRRKKLE